MAHQDKQQVALILQSETMWLNEVQSKLTLGFYVQIESVNKNRWMETHLMFLITSILVIFILYFIIFYFNH